LLESPLVDQCIRLDQILIYALLYYMKSQEFKI
jgi:hypothetical protein